jgi:hypothetical protein
LDTPFTHQLKKSALIHAPVSFVPFKGFEYIVRGSKQGLMNVLDGANRLQEKGEIFGLCEPRELRRVMKAYVNYLSHP